MRWCSRVDKAFGVHSDVHGSNPALSEFLLAVFARLTESGDLFGAAHRVGTWSTGHASRGVAVSAAFLAYRRPYLMDTDTSHKLIRHVAYQIRIGAVSGAYPYPIRIGYGYGAQYRVSE